MSRVRKPPVTCGFVSNSTWWKLGEVIVPLIDVAERRQPIDRPSVAS
jgi:hypothetical protein